MFVDFSSINTPIRVDSELPRDANVGTIHEFLSDSPMLAIASSHTQQPGREGQE